MNYRQLLEREGIIPATGKDIYMIKCPFHGEKNGAALKLNLDKNVFICFSGKCGEKGTLKRFLMLLGLQYSATGNSLITWEGKHTRKDFNRPLKPNTEAIPKEFDLQTFQKYHKKDYTYLTKRGITQDICERNQITYSHYYRRVYIPYWQDGICYGYVGRTNIEKTEYQLALQWIAKRENETNYNVIENNLQNGLYDKYLWIKRLRFYQRYRNNYGLLREKLVFMPLSNPDSDFLIVTEGMINGLQCNVYGTDSNSIIGSSPNEYHVNKIYQNANRKTVITAFDNDSAGKKNLDKFRYLAKRPVLAFNWQLLPEYKNDINQLSEEEFYHLLMNPVFINKCNNNLTK